MHHRSDDDDDDDGSGGMVAMMVMLVVMTMVMVVVMLVMAAATMVKMIHNTQTHKLQSYYKHKVEYNHTPTNQPLPDLPRKRRSLNFATLSLNTDVPLRISERGVTSFPAVITTFVPSGMSTRDSTRKASGRDLFERQCEGSRVQQKFGCEVGTTFCSASSMRLDSSDGLPNEDSIPILP